jgi:hypothetical protein
LLHKAEEQQKALVDSRVVLRHLLHGDGIGEPLAKAVSAFLHEYHLPATYNCPVRESYDAYPAADRWRAIREALRVDADTPLPT